MRYAPLIMLLLVGCSVLKTNVDRGYSQADSWDTPVTYTTADVRIITQRKHPVWGTQVVCAEPSPDVAKALSTAFQLTAQGGNGTTSARAGGGGGSAEAAMELAGRTTALLALRDGLFRACEAFSNGVIGADAYAHILSRYGKVMTTLFLGQDITGTAGAGGHAAAVSPTINIPPDSLQQGVQQKGDGNPSGGNNPGESQNGTATVSAEAAKALTEMNKDYHSNRDFLHLLIVTCLNENDVSRFHNNEKENEWLSKLCTDINSVDKIVCYIQKIVELDLVIQDRKSPTTKSTLSNQQPSRQSDCTHERRITNKRPYVRGAGPARDQETETRP